MNSFDCKIQRIPLEILTLIFLECVPYPTRHHPGPSLSRSHPAVVVSHVCHAWRQLALSTPRLWSGMRIQTPRLDAHEDPLFNGWLRKAAAVREAIAAWKERSAGQPLSIVFDVPCVAKASECLSIHTSIFLDVLRFSERWREIHIDIQDSRCMAAQYMTSIIGTFSAAEFKFPSLTSFSIFFTPNENMDFLKNWISVILLNSKLFAGPKLRAVNLAGYWDLPKRLIIGHWTSLRELAIEPCRLGQRSTLFSAHHALQFLRHLSQLTSVSFILHHEKPGQIVQRDTAMTLPNLQKLSLRGVPMGPGFAQSLVLPSLTSMYLAFDAYENDGQDLTPATLAEYGEGILELLRRFGGQLTALAIDPIPLSSFPSCLDYLDSGRLETLRLIDRHVSTSHPNLQSEVAARRELTHAALVYLGNPSVLLHLKHLGMTVRDDSSHICQAALAELVKGRRRMEVVVEKGLQEE